MLTIMEKSKVAIVKNPTAPDAQRISEMLDEVLGHLGGIEKFVKRGDKVTIKGNFYAPFPPPVTVDRRVAAALIKALYRAGASHVTLCEAVSVGTKMGRKTTTEEILRTLGIRRAAEEAGASVLCLEDDERVQVKIPNGVSIGEVSYPKSMLDCDVLVDLCCMKTHTMALVTLGLKNFQGVLTDSQKYYAHRDDLEQKLVDVFKIRKPDLTIIDGLIAMEGEGAGEKGKPHPMNLLIGSADVVAADSVAGACMGFEDVLDVPVTRIAQYDGIGNASLDRIEVLGNSIDSVKEQFVLPVTFRKPQDRYLTGCYSNVDVHIGGACRQCWLMATTAAMTLAKFRNRHFTLFVGSDPKLGNPVTEDLDNVIFLGDCACAATGELKELRNKMLLENKGLLAPGCPPYRPATAMIEKYLAERGLINEEKMAESRKRTVKRFYDYYKAVDPTWEPEE